MSSSMRDVFIGIAILLVLFYIFWYEPFVMKALINFNNLDPETLRSKTNDLKETLHEDVALNISLMTRLPMTNKNTSPGGLRVSASKQETPYHRIDNIPENTESLPFLKNFKNPCWREAVGRTNSARIRCLPYFHSVGPRKCGSTDIHRRLIRHPQISSNVMKEIQWLARFRFGDFSPTSAWLNTFYWKSSFSKFNSNADVIHHLYPGSKIILTLRNPVTRSYSDYKHYTPNPTPELFHTKVVATIQEFDRFCRNATNLRQCLYTLKSYQRSAFLLIGIHHSYLEDFLRLFPREQIFITRVEDRSKDMASALKKLFAFLEIKSLPEDTVEDIARQTIANKSKRKVPEMLNKTRIILEEFYKPFNDILGNLIGQEYNYNMYK